MDIERNLSNTTIGDYRNILWVSTNVLSSKWLILRQFFIAIFLDIQIQLLLL
jgi:hypothetical protein